MKKLLNKLKSTKSAKTVSNEKGQGATEYILMLAVLIAVVFLAKDKIKDFVNSKMGQADQASGDIFSR